MPSNTAFAPYFAVIRLRIREARKAAELTQEEAAARAGLPARVWQRYEGRRTDISDPGLRTLQSIARGLDLDLERLLRFPSSQELRKARDLEYWPEPRRD